MRRFYHRDDFSAEESAVTEKRTDSAALLGITKGYEREFSSLRALTCRDEEKRQAG